MNVITVQYYQILFGLPSIRRRSSVFFLTLTVSILMVINIEKLVKNHILDVKNVENGVSLVPNSISPFSTEVQRPQMN